MEPLPLPDWKRSHRRFGTALWSRRGTRTGKAAPARERSRNAGSLLVEVCAGPDNSDLEIPESAPRALTRSSTSRVETPCRTGSITTANTADPPGDAAQASWGRTSRCADWAGAAPNPQPGRQRPWPVPVALREPRLGPLVRPGADHGRQLSLDHRLVDHLGCLADPGTDLGHLQRFQYLQAVQTV